MTDPSRFDQFVGTTAIGAWLDPFGTIHVSIRVVG
jgi:hypothetical protein